MSVPNTRAVHPPEWRGDLLGLRRADRDGGHSEARASEVHDLVVAAALLVGLVLMIAFVVIGSLCIALYFEW